MSVLTANSIASYARQAGFSGSNLVTAIAIALAESGGNTQAYNPETAARTPIGSGSRGLWQIYGYAHPQYNNNSLYDPLTNARAAFQISSGGYSFIPWSTYTSGEYQSYTAIASMAANVSNNVPVTTGKPIVASSIGYVDPSKVPWVTYPRIDNLGGVEPFGGFPKPDSNIQIPTNFPVQALLPGTVTAVDGGEVAWGAVVTIKLDTPINSLATHTAYLHLARATVGVGQHVNSGDLIAYNGLANAAGTQKVPLGFAFYNGDHYGFGSAWALETKANLQGLLNPVPTILLAQQGKLMIDATTATAVQNLQNFINGTTTNQVITSASETAFRLVNEVPGFTGICEALDMSMQFVPFTLPTQASQDISNATSAPTDVTVFGWDTGVINPFAVGKQVQAVTQLPADAIQAVLVFTTTNFAAFAIRSLFVGVGLILFIALMINLISSFIDVKDIASTATSLAPILAA